MELASLCSQGAILNKTGAIHSHKMGEKLWKKLNGKMPIVLM